MTIDFASEGPDVEWKVSLPRADAIVKTLCAFANGTGGTIWIGVDDAGAARGVEQPNAVIENVRELARSALEPAVDLQAKRVRAASADLVRIDVCANPERVVQLHEGDVYVRDGSSSRPASAQEVRALRRSRGVRPRLDATARKLLGALRAGDPPTRTELGRRARLGPKALKRSLVPLMQAGLVSERPDRRLWLTPRGHAALS